MSPHVDAAEAAVRNATAEINRLMIEARSGQLDELLADEFVLVHITGYEQPKSEWLAEIRGGSMNYHGIREQSATVTVTGDTAVVVARNLTDATIWGSRAVWRLRMTTTFSRRNGTWVPIHARAVTF